MIIKLVWPQTNLSQVRIFSKITFFYKKELNLTDELLNDLKYTIKNVIVLDLDVSTLILQTN